MDDRHLLVEAEDLDVIGVIIHHFESSAAQASNHTRHQRAFSFHVGFIVGGFGGYRSPAYH